MKCWELVAIFGFGRRYTHNPSPSRGLGWQTLRCLQRADRNPASSAWTVSNRRSALTSLVDRTLDHPRCCCCCWKYQCWWSMCRRCAAAKPISRWWWRWWRFNAADELQSELDTVDTACVQHLLWTPLKRQLATKIKMASFNRTRNQAVRST